MTDHSATSAGTPPPGGPTGSTAISPDAGLDPFLFTSRHIVQAASEGIITVDEAQRIVMINPAAQRMFGCTATEALGSHLSRFIPQRHRDAHAEHVRGFDASGAAERPMGLRSAVTGLRANGEEFPARATISRLDVEGASGTRRYFTALVRDLTEVQHLQQEIDQLNTRVRTIFELAPIAIWITDSDRIVFANRACVELFGASHRKDLMGRSIFDLLGPESQQLVHQAVDKALKTNTNVPVVKEQIACLDGTTRDVEIAIAPLPDHGSTALQMVITDITRRMQETREAEQSRQELRQLSANLVQAREEERRRIAREMHDELGQRLTTLHMELSNLPGGQTDPALADSVGTMIAMLDETVASVRRIATELRPLMLDDLGLKAAIEWLSRDWTRRRGIPVRLDLWEEDPPIGDSRAIAVYRMVQEALTNVIRHARASHAEISLRLDGNDVLLTVQDDGVGFDPPSLKRQGSHGLLGIRERAYMFGGQMEVGRSALGGARIAVRLPLDPRPYDDLSGEPATPQGGEP